MEQAEHPPSPHAVNDQTSSNESSTSSDEQEDITERPNDIPTQLQPQVARFLALRQRLQKSQTENQREVYQEHQRKHENTDHHSVRNRRSRKRREAELLQHREQYTGDDYERTRFKDYSIERVEKYEGKQREREENREKGFTDYEQVNSRKYNRDIAKLKPSDLATAAAAAAHHRQKSGQDGDHKPEQKNVERLAKTVMDQQKKRATLHKPSIEQEGEDVSYINERNARFNRKMNRAYDKYTKEVKDNFERGTAL
ncbi:pre-mRNA-splicing factor SYF2 [Coemansia sp. RSA 2424]|nr:pre-mRNA-splicing factor SYF2 [Coemansia sp. RSA 2424]